MTNVSLLHHCHMFILGTFVGGSTRQKWGVAAV